MQCVVHRQGHLAQKLFSLFAENSLSTVFRLAPFFLSTNLPLERGVPFIGVFELAPLRGWIRAITRGQFLSIGPWRGPYPPPDPPKKKSFFPRLNFIRDYFFF